MNTSLFVYEASLFIILTLSILSIYSKNKNFIFFASLVILLLFSFFYGFRDIVIYNKDGFTTDTYRYALIWFSENKTLTDVFFGSSSWKMDYLFFLFQFIIHFISDNPQVYLFLNALASFLILFFAYYKILALDKKTYIYPFILLMLYTTSTVMATYGNLLRQGLAISFVMLSIAYLLSTENKKSFLILFLSTFIHKSTLIFFPIFYLIFKISMKKYFFIYLSSLPLIFLNISIFFQKINFFILSKISIYQESDSRMLLKKIIILNILAIIFYYFRKIRKIRFNKNYDTIFKIYLSTLIISNIFFHIEIISGRLLYYPSILLPYFFLNIIYVFKQKKLSILVVIIFCIFYSLVIAKFSSTFSTITFSKNLKGLL